MSKSDIVVWRDPRSRRWHWCAKWIGRMVSKCPEKGFARPGRAIQAAKDFAPDMVGGEFEMISLHHANGNTDPIWRRQAF